jgi:tetratricopeptide (TPR) repeat protein
MGTGNGNGRAGGGGRDGGRDGGGDGGKGGGAGEGPGVGAGAGGGLKELQETASRLFATGRLKEALEAFTRFRTLAWDELGPDHMATLKAGVNMAQVLLPLGRPAEAKVILEAAVPSIERGAGPDGYEAGLARHVLGMALRMMGMPAEARAEQERAYFIFKEALPEGHLLLTQSTAELGEVALDEGWPDKAVRILTGVLAERKARFGPRHVRTAAAMDALGRALEAAGDPTAAGRLRGEAEKLKRRNGLR